MYHFTPTDSGKTAKGVSLGLFLGALILYISPILIELPYKGIWQTAALVCFVGAIALLTRFVFKRFCYDIVENGESLDFTVTEIQGKGRITVCRIALSSIEKVQTLDKGQRADEADTRGRRKFSYLPDIFTPKQCLIFATECGEKLLIKIAPDDLLINILSSRKDS